MLNQFSRTELLLGKEAMDKLENARVAVFGIGGVGGYVCEALVRSGVGAFDLIDDDKVCLTNLNRQIIATRKTVGQYKTEVMRDRILDINPKADVRIHNCFYLPENAADFDFSEYDYVVDGFIIGFVVFFMAMAHIDKVFTEFPFFNELFQLLHIEGVVQEVVELIPLVDYPFPACPSPDREGGGKEIVIGHILGDFFGVKSGNHADAGVIFVFIQHLLAEL